MIWDRIALALVIIGALNWGAIGLFGFDLVAFICGGQMAVLSRVIYTVVGIAGLWCVSLLFRRIFHHQALFHGCRPPPVYLARLALSQQILKASNILIAQFQHISLAFLEEGIVYAHHRHAGGFGGLAGG